MRWMRCTSAPSWTTSSASSKGAGLNDPLVYRALYEYHHGRLSLLQCLMIVARASLAAKDAYQAIATEALAVSARPIYLGFDPARRE